MPRRKIISTLGAILVIAIAAYGSHSPTDAAKPLPAQDAAASSTTPPHPIPSYAWYSVVRVVDGDTIVIHKDDADVKVRLIGVDTPEVVDPRKKVQCFGKEASAETKKLLNGSSVRIETDPSQDTFDKYGRLLAYVYAPANSRPEGILVNKYLIAEGFAHEYTYRIPYKYQTDFKAAENAARDAQKGLWATTACIGMQ